MANGILCCDFFSFKSIVGDDIIIIYGDLFIHFFSQTKKYKHIFMSIKTAKVNLEVIKHARVISPYFLPLPLM